MSTQDTYEAAHLRFALHDGFDEETVGLGSLDGANVSIRVFIDDDETLHIIVLDSVSPDSLPCAHEDGWESTPDAGVTGGFRLTCNHCGFDPSAD